MSDLFLDEWGSLRGWVILVLILLSTALFVGSLIGFGLVVDHKSCQNTAEILDVAHEWRVIGGCYLEFDGQMVPESVWQHLTLGVMP